jgi:arginyl-tRNA synthetase
MAYKNSSLVFVEWLAKRVETAFEGENIARQFISSDVPVSEPENDEFGDWSTNLPFVLAKPLRKSPRAIGETIISEPIDPSFGSVWLAGAGYINFRFADRYLHEILKSVLTDPTDWYKLAATEPKKVQVEFVSANPTGPLNVVSARAAAVGSTVVNCMKASGIESRSEFYVNDTGNQANTLEKSFIIRIEQLEGKEAQIADDCYPGEYLIDYAREYIALDKPSDPREWILSRIIADQKAALEKFAVNFDEWFSEAQ